MEGNPLESKPPRRQRGKTRSTDRTAAGPSADAAPPPLPFGNAKPPASGLAPIAKVPALPPLSRLPATGMAGGHSRTTTPRIGTGAGAAGRRKRRGSKGSNPDIPEGGPSPPVELPPVSARSGNDGDAPVAGAAPGEDGPPVEEEWEDDDNAEQNDDEPRFGEQAGAGRGKRPPAVVTGTPREGADGEEEFETQEVEPKRLEFEEDDEEEVQEEVQQLC